MRIQVAVAVFLVAVVSACTTGDLDVSSSDTSDSGVGVCQVPPEAERPLPESDFTLTVVPNPVSAGGEADLVIEVAPDAPEEITNAPETDVATGAGARFQCWDGSAWIDTHQLLKNGFGPDSKPAAIPIGPDVTIPAVGLVLYDQPYTIVVPDIPPGIYRIQDSVIVGSSDMRVYSLVELGEAN